MINRNLKTPEGFQKILWNDVCNGQEVYLNGTHLGQPKAYGSHKVKNKESRTLINNRGTTFFHLPEELLIPKEIIKRCADCRDGEHDNFDEDVLLVVVKDSSTNKIIKRSYMCAEHRGMYYMSGNVLYHDGRKL